MKRRLTRFAVILAFAGMILGAARVASAQDWFTTGTGLGVSKVRLAVPATPARSAAAQPFQKTFHDVLWADLNYSGIVDMVSESFYPLSAPSQPSELNAQQWSAEPCNAYMVAYGNLNVNGTNLSFAGYLSDVHSQSATTALQKIYTDAATDEGARKLAHEFADDIVSLLSGGQPGIAQTRIAYVSAHNGDKEIWEMDYDGANQHQLTHLRTISLTPRWSPDGSRIAFTCYVPYRGAPSAQICMYSTISNRLIAFPHFPGTNSSPAWSPNGMRIAFMSSRSGGTQIYIANADGTHMQQITYAAGVNTSPVFNPKTAQQIVFVSDRAGDPVLYMSNVDGSNVQKIDLPDMGYVVDPAWSPNGQLLAFSWRRPTGNYDIYVMDIVGHQLVELTKDEGRNERPTWAPDGRHLAFESTRTGTNEIWTMLADGSQPRQLTFRGENESPNWSPKD
jgi:TolB protein